MQDRLRVIGYEVVQVSITQNVIPKIVKPKDWPQGDEYARYTSLMDAGNEARKRSGDDSILALGAAAFMNSSRERTDKDEGHHRPRYAYIVSALKRPEEVGRLRAIYPQGFYLIGVHADHDRRLKLLTQEKRISAENAEALIKRDRDEEQEEHGQRVEETFHLSDFFVRDGSDDDRFKPSIWRLLDLLFGNPYVTPTFDEYAMFMAFVASLRSADLSRQVGAVVSVNEQVVATGANDTPKAGGGQYWPAEDKLPDEVTFPDDGRDFALGHDSNKMEQQRIIDEILSRAEKAGVDRAILAESLEQSRIRDLTEFGRVVHAEMEALLSCARENIATRKGTLYATTFPCHNCAKHIVAAGIARVVYIEPYAKSKAAEFHPDSIRVGFLEATDEPEGRTLVLFEPFVGVGPRRFFDLFSMGLGSGYTLKRKDATGRSIKWNPEQGRLRLQMLPISYLHLEFIASDMFNRARESKEQNDAE